MHCINELSDHCLCHGHSHKISRRRWIVPLDRHRRIERQILLVSARWRRVITYGWQTPGGRIIQQTDLITKAFSANTLDLRPQCHLPVRPDNWGRWPKEPWSATPASALCPHLLWSIVRWLIHWCWSARGRRLKLCPNRGFKMLMLNTPLESNHLCNTLDLLSAGYRTAWKFLPRMSYDQKWLFGSYSPFVFNFLWRYTWCIHRKL